MNPIHERAWREEMAAARARIGARELDAAFLHLQRAHVLGQERVVTHVLAHWHMLRVAILRADAGAAAGQVVRIVLGALGSALGAFPKGNTGGSDVSMFATMPIDAELLRILEGRAQQEPAGSPDAPACAAPDFAPRKPRLAFAPLSCDCHAHILGPAARHPYAPERIYTPPDCLPSDYRAMLATLGVERAVLVQPSVYGTDNSAMLHALREAGPAFRAVAVVDWAIGDAALDAMHAEGVRGVRVNVVDVKEGALALPLERLNGLARRISRLGWHMELLAHVDRFASLDRDLGGFPVDLVFGHLGYMPAGKGLEAPGFQALLRLLADGRCWVKLTGPYRISALALPHADVVPYAHALLDAAPTQVVWGSDWPHVMVEGAMPNDGDLADLLLDWIPDADMRRRVLVENPARLYGFP
jgi:predicted TIM-barrel fold metal-dependent hydrolase